MGSALTVYRRTDEEPVRFAAGELRRYLRRMTGHAVRVSAAGRYEPNRPGIWVGTAEAFPKAAVKGMPKRTHEFDDAIFVRAQKGHAVISGVNARSVVFAAYRYLEALGCRWLRPGRDGERVPRLPAPLSRRISIAEAPTYRHRCICIEGSCSEEHVRDMVDYAARRGFNSYFLQFRDSYTFFNRWYGDEGRGRKGKPMPQPKAARICERIKDDLHSRGMIIHRVGHGWTCDPFGVVANEWTPTRQRVPAAVRKLFAKVKGKRALWGGIPLNTQLCYSNAQVREMMAQAVAEYADAHRDEQVIHFWLADGANNFCECASCRRARPSEFYVEILNRIDELLTERGLPTRIVFLAYVNLLWAPRAWRVRNPDRFILMFAPITRTYSTALLEDKTRGERVGPYVCNKVSFPRSPRANLKLLAGWREHFKGDCVDFDYHLWRDHFYDPGQTALASVLFKDVRDLGKLGMDGFISCQVQRVFFPTGLHMHMMGLGLWNARTRCESAVRDYFTDVFGPRGREAMRYMQRLTALFDPPLLRGERQGEAARAKAAKNFAAVGPLVNDFMPVIEKGCRSADRVTAASWRILRHHAWYVTASAEVLRAAYAGERERALALFGAWQKGLRRRLPQLQHVLDTTTAVTMMRHVLWCQKVITD